MTSRLQQLASSRRPRAGFTLIELLVVIAVIGILAAILFAGLGGTGRSASLQSAQATVANCVTAARTRAMAAGRNARLLVQIDPGSVNAHDRFLRYIVLQVDDGTQWQTLSTFLLPEGVALLPRYVSSFSKLVESPAAWTRPSDGGELRSSAFRSVATNYPDAEVSLAINSATVERWAAVKFAAAGTTSNVGDLVVGMTNILAPGSGSLPCQFVGPDAVRGVSITTYGLPVQINGRDGF